MLTIDPDITELWCEVYEAIRQAWENHEFAPSQKELSEACNCSTASVIVAIRNLKNKGYITVKKFEPRSAKPVDRNQRLLRYEPDPWDSLADENIWLDD